MDDSENSPIFQFRILDASINRASEGLRVVEDFARMGLSDPFLTSLLKNLRHDLTVATDPIDSLARIQARNSERDVGRTITTEQEFNRENLLALIRSNMARVQQALRTIEEYCKSSFGQIAADVEQLRYRAYTLEKAIVNTAFNGSRLAKAHLYVLVDGCGGDSEKLIALCSGLADAGVSFIQLRDKMLNDRQRITAGKTIAAAIDETDCRWIMNDRADLALAAGADGVHLGQEDASVHCARQILGSGKFIGVSTHDIDQARQAVIDGADYIGIGPTFPSTTKAFDQFPGLDFVKAVTAELSIPAFAIGGINAGNLGEVIAAGCRRVAVASAITGSNTPGKSATEFLQPLVAASETG